MKKKETMTFYFGCLQCPELLFSVRKVSSPSAEAPLTQKQPLKTGISTLMPPETRAQNAQASQRVNSLSPTGVWVSPLRRHQSPNLTTVHPVSVHPEFLEHGRCSSVIPTKYRRSAVPKVTCIKA